MFEQLMDRFQAECLVAHISGKKHLWSDATSRVAPKEIPRLLAKFNKDVQMGHLKLVELEAVTFLHQSGPHREINLHKLDEIKRLGSGDRGPFT